MKNDVSDNDYSDNNDKKEINKIFFFWNVSYDMRFLH